MRGWMMVSLVASVILFAGCTGKGNSTDAQASGQSNSGAGGQPAQQSMQQPIAVPANAPPETVVMTFLNALRSGDSPTTESLLTRTARQELAKHSLSVDVQPAANATYQVRPAEYLQNDPSGAHVSSIWTEKFENGDETYEIVWALRRQEDGWRLAGMAMELIPGQQVQFLNFENPGDMLKKKEEAIAAMQAPAAQTAQQPQTLPPAQRPVER